MSTTTVGRYVAAEIAIGPAPADPWAELDVDFTTPDGGSHRVPAFQRDGQWMVRYSSGQDGHYRWAAAEVQGSVVVDPDIEPDGHGPLVVSANGRHLEHADGTPFLWLADTWWFAFASAKSADEEFAALAHQRAAQGFTVIQLAAGLVCEVGPFDPAARARSGWAWELGFEAPNLEWWDEADGRLHTLLEHGLIPCVFGSWGFHLAMLDDRQLRRHWREMVARWGALPVVWCLAGEPPLLWYEELAELVARRDHADGGRSLSEWGLDAREQQALESRQQVEVLNRLAGYVRGLDPFGRLVTVHTITGVPPWELLDDPSSVDFWMLQTGHYGYASLGPSVNATAAALDRSPRKPVINGEACYEGIAGSSWSDVQRFLFWSHLLMGAAGHSYGAHGLWAFNTDEFSGQFSGNAPSWPVAASYPGATQLGVGRQILLRYPWHEAVPSSDAVATDLGAGEHIHPYSVRLPDGRRLVYVPSLALSGGPARLRLTRLEGRSWSVTPIDLVTGAAHASFKVTPQDDDSATLPGLFWPLPDWSDWLLDLSPL